MKLTALGTDVAAVAAGTSVEMNVTPFMQKQSAVACILANALVGTYKIQGSDDGTTWTDLLTVSDGGSKMLEVKLYQYMRDNMTAFTSGKGSSYLLADN